MGLGEFASQPHNVGRGRVGEDAAVAWLEGQGYRVVIRNHRNDCGEIDVVAWDGDTLCFVEIKARASDLHGGAVAAVGRPKQRRLARAAALYLALAGGPTPPCRFDVLAVDREAGGDAAAWRFTLLRNAFEVG